MKAVILAAGMGKRMGRLTENTPKCLLEINGKKIVHKQIDTLLLSGISDISIVVGYRGEAVRQACAAYDVKFYTNPQYKTTGMLTSLYCARDELNDDFILMYGDVFIGPRTIRNLMKKSGEICLVIDTQKHLNPLSESDREVGSKLHKGSTKVLVRNKNIFQISKNLEGATGEFIGIVKFSQRKAEFILDRIRQLHEENQVHLYPSPSYVFSSMLSDGHVLTVCEVNEEYAEIDYVSDLVEAKERYDD